MKETKSYLAGIKRGVPKEIMDLFESTNPYSKTLLGLVELSDHAQWNNLLIKGFLVGFEYARTLKK